MIKKNTTIIFIDGDQKREEILKGGMPLGVGEIIDYSSSSESKIYKVIGKKIAYIERDEEHEVNVVYTLELQ